MNEYDLFDAIGGIDEELLSRSEHRAVRKFPIRKALIAAAAVMALLVTVYANDWTFSASWLVATYGEKDTGHIRTTHNAWYLVEDSSFYVDDQEIFVIHAQVFTRNKLDYYVEFPGETIKGTLEAMILMEDGRMEYKQIELTGTEQISLQMDHFIGEESGTIITVRNRLFYEIDGTWEEVHERYCYLPGHLGFQVPYGIDPRFPDMQYNYDGRVPAG